MGGKPRSGAVEGKLELLPPILQDGRKSRKLYTVPNKQTKPTISFFKSRIKIKSFLEKCSYFEFYIALKITVTVYPIPCVSTKQNNSKSIKLCP